MNRWPFLIPMIVSSVVVAGCEGNSPQFLATPTPEAGVQLPILQDLASPRLETDFTVVLRNYLRTPIPVVRASRPYTSSWRYVRPARGSHGRDARATGSEIVSKSANSVLIRAADMR